MLKIEEFKEEDLVGFIYDGVEKDNIDTSQIKQNIRTFNSQGLCFTGRVGEEVVGFSGLFEMPYDVAYAWTYINRAAYPHIKTVIKTMHKMLKVGNYTRVQAMCIDDMVTRRMMEAIGYQFEGVLRKVEEGRDMVMYSILREELPSLGRCKKKRDIATSLETYGSSAIRKSHDFPLALPPEEIKKKILQFEQAVEKHPDSIQGDIPGSLKEFWGDEIYIREWHGEAGTWLTTKVHGKKHPFFIMKGEALVVEPDRTKRIVAPHWGITEPGTKRLIYCVTDVTWITCHGNPDNCKDSDEIEENIILPNWSKQIEE